MPSSERPVSGAMALLAEAAMLVAVIWLFPVAILVVGAPVALLVWVLVEIAKRL